MERIKPISDAILKKKGFFSLDQVTRETRLDRCAVCHVLEKLFLEKIIQRVSSRKIENFYERRGRPFYLIIYRLKNRQALIDKISPKLKPDTAQDRMWKIIRYQKQFTRRDLRILAEASYEMAKWFTKMLARAGYLKRISFDGWVLIKDPGPRRPYVGRGK